MGSKKVELFFENCGKRKSKKNPNTYSKDQLVALFLKYYEDVTESKAKKYNSEQLCEFLKKADLEPKDLDEISKLEKVIKTKKPAKSPKAKGRGKKKKEEKEEEIEISEDKSSTCTSKLELKKYQQKVVDFIMSDKNRGLIVNHSMGAGKTLPAATAAMCFLFKNKVGNVYVITPKSLQDNFKIAIERDFKGKKDYQNAVDNFDKLNSRIIVMSYQTFRSKLMGKQSEHKGKKLVCTKNDMLIFDEGHTIRTGFETALFGGAAKKENKQSKTVVASLHCAKDVKKILILTGTPIYNSLDDIINLIAIIRGETNVLKLMRSKELENLIINDDPQLKKFLKCSISTYIAPKTVDFPKSYEYIIPITIDPKSEFGKEYALAEARVRATQRKVLSKEKGEQIKKESNAFAVKLRQYANNLSSCPKCNYVLKILDGRIFEGKETNTKKFTPKTMRKTVIYSFFKNSGIEILMKVLEKEGYKFDTITGDSVDRQKVVNKYNTNKIKLLLITKAAGEGLDLKGTRTVIIFEPHFNLALIEQVKFRAIRFGSHSHLTPEERRVDIYNLILSKKNVDPLELIKTKTVKKMIGNREVSFNQTLKLLNMEHASEDKKRSLAASFLNSPNQNPYPAIDQIMYGGALLKQAKLDMLIQKLNDYSIENDKDC